MVLHDAPTGKLQVVGTLNRRRNADNCVRYLLYYFASLLYLHAKHFRSCIGILKSSFVSSRYFWTTVEMGV